MAEEWMQMARREVPAALRAVGVSAGAIEELLDTAKALLAESADEMRELRVQDNPVQPVDGFFQVVDPEQPPAKIFQVGHPAALLEEARPSLDVLRMSHAAGGRAFRMYRARLRLGRADGSGDPAWQDWHDNNLKGNRRAGTALGKVIAAASYAKAAADAVDMSTAEQPFGTAGWKAWASAYERLAERAMFEIDRAIDELRALRHAALAEYGHAMKILYPESS